MKLFGWHFGLHTHTLIECEQCQNTIFSIVKYKYLGDTTIYIYCALFKKGLVIFESAKTVTY